MYIYVWYWYDIDTIWYDMVIYGYNMIWRGDMDIKWWYNGSLVLSSVTDGSMWVLQATYDSWDAHAMTIYEGLCKVQADIPLKKHALHGSWIWMLGNMCIKF